MLSKVSIVGALATGVYSMTSRHSFLRLRNRWIFLPSARTTVLSVTSSSSTTPSSARLHSSNIWHCRTILKLLPFSVPIVMWNRPYLKSWRTTDRSTYSCCLQMIIRKRPLRASQTSSVNYATKESSRQR